MLGIRAAWRDLGATTAELVYGETLRLPGQFLGDQPVTTKDDDTSHLISTLRNLFNHLQPIMGTNHDAKQPFVFKDLATTSHVFVRHDGPQTIVQPPYDGSFLVLKRTGKTVQTQVKGKTVDVSIDRTKPAYLLAEPIKTMPDATIQ